MGSDFMNSATTRDPQIVTVLGSTGSIGRSTLEVLSQHPESYRVFALTANNNTAMLVDQCKRLRPHFAVLLDAKAAAEVREQLSQLKIPTEVLEGIDNLVAVASASEVDTVMAAIVGAAGLLPTFAAVKAGKKVLLANKETLVMAGGLFIQAQMQSKAQLLPIDSEHNAIFQCLPHDYSDPKQAGITRLLLTGSGGPFRQWSCEAMRSATPEQACNHPKWSMGKKISVDSATLMNKGLEIIEACWLFAMTPDLIDVVIHPQSVVHSMVEYIDGSILAHLGNPDMKVPIAHALAWPHRIVSGATALDIIASATLDFEAPDNSRFPALSMAVDSMCVGAGAPVLLNAANEVAVEAFLQRAIRFDQIAEIWQRVMDSVESSEPEDLDMVQHLDRVARSKAVEQVRQLQA